MFRLSLRELFAVVAAIACGLTALLYANAWWASVLKTALVAAVIFAAIAATIQRGPGQAFAIGFLAGSLFYYGAGLVDSIADQPSADLLTDIALGELYDGVVRRVYRDWQTNEELSRDELPSNARIVGRGVGITIPSARPVYSRIARPPRDEFFQIGRVSCTLFVGYLAGHVGRLIHSRRMRQATLAGGG